MEQRSVARFTISKARNFMGRAMDQILDPEPSDSEWQRMLRFFKETCAYCGDSLIGVRWERDHLRPSSETGGNFVGNRVPACPGCNSSRRESGWEDFLRSIADPTDAEVRTRRIRQWMANNPPRDHAPHSPAVQMKIDRVTAARDEWTKAMIDLRQ